MDRRQPDTDPDSDRDAFDKITEQGTEGGLYKACMKSIRSAHLRANRLRAALVLAGLFTDKSVYRDVVTVFYFVTKELEKKLDAFSLEKQNKADEDSADICKKILSLGYRFTPQYEEDMEELWGEEWKAIVDNYIRGVPAARSYVHLIRDEMSNGRQLAGAAFVLWGALIIGGGAAAYPRVKALVGPEATHLFEDVTGPGRERRKQVFIRVWESLAAREANETSYKEIVRYTEICMQHNNDIFTSLQRNPWWTPYIVALPVAVIASLLGWLRYR